jgi:LmbE family N-acetylglucosaminyl deacetylase
MAALNVLVIVPHPDDAEFHAGGLIARFISEGASVHIVTATDGRCGTYRHTGDEIAAIRVKEAQNAANYLGASLEFMGYSDYDLSLTDANQLRERLVRLIRSHQPDVIIEEDAFQSDQVHPDHRTLAMTVSDAVNFSQLPNVYPQHREEGIFPHYVKEKYAFTDDPARMNCVIDITKFLETKLTAMKLHQSQVEFLVEDVLLQAKAAGLDLQQAAGQSLEDPVQLLVFAMMSQMAEIGKITGVSYAEGYRYVRFHPFIENLLKKS